MGESGKFFYKGLPQEDLSKQTSPFPRILSSGVKKNEKATEKKRKVTPTVIVILLVFVAVSICLGVIFSLRYGGSFWHTVSLPQMTPPSSIKMVIHKSNETSTPKPIVQLEVTQENQIPSTIKPKFPDDKTSSSTTKPKTIEPNATTKATQIQLETTTAPTLNLDTKQINDSEAKTVETHIEVTTETTIEATTEATATEKPEDSKSSSSTSPKIIPTTTPPVPKDEPKKVAIASTSTTSKPTDSLVNEPKAPMTEPMKENKSEEPTKFTTTKSPIMSEPIDTSKDQAKKSNDTSAKSVVTTKPKPEGSSNDTKLPQKIKNVNSQTNKTATKGIRGFMHTMESLLKNPTVEVVMVAIAVVMIGIGLIVTGLTCMITRPKRIRRRRQGRAASKDLEPGSENVILLTEDASEDEFVQA